jgi:hypothetical protein
VRVTLPLLPKEIGTGPARRGRPRRVILGRSPQRRRERHPLRHHPFFALILLGWWAARRQLLPAQAVPGLNSFVLYFALPALLLRFGWRTPVATLFDPLLLGLYLVVGLAVVGLSVAWARRAACPAATPPSAPWWPPFRTAASWACPCWWPCWGRPPPAR